MARSIAGKVVIVTGASSGIGRATALALAGEKAALVLVARRQALLDELKTQVEAAGGKAKALAFDLRRREEVQRMISEAHAAFGRIDALINNAGFGYYGTVEGTPEAVTEEIFALNFSAPMVAIQSVLPIMRAQRSGHIINVSSVVGKRGLPLSGVYCATKFALEGLTESLRLEVKPDGVDVSIVNPAATRTDFFDQVRRGGGASGRFYPTGPAQTADHVARSIVACLKRPKIEVYPLASSRALAWMNALAPSVVDRLMMAYYRRSQNASK